jgi:hypothetical protein
VNTVAAEVEVAGTPRLAAIIAPARALTAMREIMFAPPSGLCAFPFSGRKQNLGHILISINIFESKPKPLRKV